MNFKTFTTFNIEQSLFHELVDLTSREEIEISQEAADPAPHAWRSVGFRPATPEGDYLHSLDGLGFLMCVQFADRILPGKVIREHTDKRVKELQDRGETVTRKERAELRDETESALLPKAFIRRSDVPLILTNDGRLLVFTATQKRVDETVQAFIRWLNIDAGFTDITYRPWSPSNSAPTLFTDLILNETSDALFPTDRATLFMGGDQSVRIAKRALESGEIHKLIEAGYQASEVALRYVDGETSEDVAEFRINDNWIIKGLKGPGLKPDDRNDFHATAYLACQTAINILGEIETWVDGYTGEEDDEL